MKRVFAISCLFFCALYLSAQTSPSQSSNPSSSQSTSPSSSQSTSATSSQTGSEHESHVRGCLGGSSGSYTLTDKSGKTYQLSGDTSKLAEHVGHTVEITGTKSSPSTGSSAATSSAAGSATEPTLTVSSMKHISGTCSSGSKEK